MVGVVTVVTPVIRAHIHIFNALTCCSVSQLFIYFLPKMCKTAPKCSVVLLNLSQHTFPTASLSFPFPSSKDSQCKAHPFD